MFINSIFAVGSEVTMNTVRGFVRSVTNQGDGTDRIAVILNNDRTVRLNVPTGTIECLQKIKLGFDPVQRTYSYPPPA